MKIIAVFLLFLSSCSLFEDDISLRLSVPDLPAVWADYINDINYKAFIYDGRLREMVFSGENTQVELNKTMNSFICVYPLLELDGRTLTLKPFGGIFPQNCENKDLFLSYENGFLCEVVLVLVKQGFDIRQFNMERLENEIKEKAFNDPWTLNKELLLNKIVSDEMSVYAVKKMESYFININLPLGVWVSENPFRESINSDGNYFDLEIVKAYQCWFSDSGIVSIFADDFKWILISPEEIQSGYW